jgi:hypothetical protein
MSISAESDFEHTTNLVRRSNLHTLVSFLDAVSDHRVHANTIYQSFKIGSKPKSAVCVDQQYGVFYYQLPRLVALTKYYYEVPCTSFMITNILVVKAGYKSLLAPLHRAGALRSRWVYRSNSQASTRHVATGQICPRKLEYQPLLRIPNHNPSHSSTWLIYSPFSCLFARSLRGLNPSRRLISAALG